MATFRSSGLDGAGFQGFVSVCPTNDGTVLSCADVAGLHRSTDWGAHWTTTSGWAYSTSHLKVAGCLWSRVAPSDICLLFTGSRGSSLGGGVWVSTDKALTFTQLAGSPAFSGGNTKAGTDPLPQPHPRSTGRVGVIDYTRNLLYVGSFSDGLYRATINPFTGAVGSFTSIGNMSGRYIRSIAIDESSNRLYAACVNTSSATDDGVFVLTSASTAAPGTATKISGAPSRPEELFIMDSVLYAVSNSGVSSTPSGTGTTWTNRSGALPVTGPHWQAIDGFVDGSGNHVLWVGCDSPSTTDIVGEGARGNSIYRTDDARSTTPAWTTLTCLKDVDTPRTYPTGELWWMSPTNDWAMLNRGGFDCASLAYSSTGYLFAAGRAGVWRLEAPLASGTGLNGKWHPTVKHLAVTINRCCTYDPTRDDVAWIGNTDWVTQVTTDGGETFANDNPPNMPNACFGICVNPHTGRVYAGIGERDQLNADGAVASQNGTGTGWTDEGLDAGQMALTQNFNTAATNAWPVTEDISAWSPTYTFSGGGSSADVSSSGGQGHMSTAGTNGTRLVKYQAAQSRASSGVCSLWRSADPVGASSAVSMLTRGQWSVGPNRYYEFRVNQLASGAKPVSLQILRQDTTPSTVLVPIGPSVDLVDLGYNWAIDTPLWVRYETSDDGTDVTLRFKAWTGFTGDEPPDWAIEYVDTDANAIAVTGGQGAKLLSASGHTSTIDYRWDNWSYSGQTVSGDKVSARVTGIGAATVGGTDVIVITRAESDTGGAHQANPVDSGGVWRKASGAWTQIMVPSVDNVMVNQGTKAAPVSWPDQGTTTGQKLYFYDRPNGVYRSTDSGQSFARIWAHASDTEARGFVSADPTNVDRLYINANGNLWLGSNAGTVAPNSLSPTNITPSGAAGNVSAIYCDHRGWIWCCTDAVSGSPAELWVSTNQGSTWTATADDTFRNSAPFVFDMTIDRQGQVYLATNGDGVLLAETVTVATAAPASMTHNATVPKFTVAAGPATVAHAATTPMVVQRPTAAAMTHTASSVTVSSVAGGPMLARQFDGTDDRLFRTTGLPALSNDWVLSFWVYVTDYGENALGIPIWIGDASNNLLVALQTIGGTNGDSSGFSTEPLLYPIQGFTTTAPYKKPRARNRARWTHYVAWYDNSANQFGGIWAANQYEEHGPANGVDVASGSGGIQASSGTRRVGTSSTNKIYIGDSQADNRAFKGALAQVKMVQGDNTWTAAQVLAYARIMQQSWDTSATPNSTGSVVFAYQLNGTGNGTGGPIVVENDDGPLGLHLSTDSTTRCPTSISTGPTAPTFRSRNLHFDVTSPAEWTLLSARRYGDSTAVTFSGTYTGTAPSSIEARMRGDTNWSTVDPAPAGGTWTGTFTMYIEPDLEIGSGVEFRANFAVPETATWWIGLGDLFIVAGQSNAQGQGGNPADLRPQEDDSGTAVYSGAQMAHLHSNYSVSGVHQWSRLQDTIDAQRAEPNIEMSSRVRWGNWSEDTEGTMDSTDTDYYSAGAGASPWPVVAGWWMRWTGRPFGALPVSRGGQGITSFEPPGSNFSTAYNSSPVPIIYEETGQRLQQISGIANGTTAISDSSNDPIRTQIKCVLWLQGESDAVNNAANSYAVTQGNFDDPFNGVMADFGEDFGCQVMAGIIGQISAADTNDEAPIAVRQYIQSQWGTLQGTSGLRIRRGPVLYDLVLETGGGFLHFRYDDSTHTLRTAAKRWAMCIYDAFIDPDKCAHRGPRLTSFTGSGTSYVLAFDQDLDGEPLGYNGINLRDGSTLRTWTSSGPGATQYTIVDGAAPHELALTLGAAPSGTINITIGEINSTNGRRVPTVTHTADGLTTTMPAEVIYRQDVANTVTVYPHSAVMSHSGGIAIGSIGSDTIDAVATPALITHTANSGTVSTSQDVTASPASMTHTATVPTPTAPETNVTATPASMTHTGGSTTLRIDQNAAATPAVVTHTANTPIVDTFTPPPVARIVYSPTAPTVVPVTVSFDATTSTGIGPLIFAWDFGDGVTSSDDNPDHTYTVAGDYVVVLTVTQLGGQTDTEQVLVRARPPAFTPPSGEGRDMIDVVRISVPSSETLIWDGGTGLGETALNQVHSENDRTYNFTFRNAGAGIIYIGPKGKTSSSTGFAIAANATIQFKAGFADRIYGTSASTSAVELLIGSE